MSWNPGANRDDVLSLAGRTGYGGNFMDSLPDGFSTSATGGATVSTDTSGTEIQSGGTTDDEAKIGAPAYENERILNGHTVVLELLFIIPDDSFYPYVNKTLVGTTRTGVSNQGAHIDLTNEEVSVHDSAVAFNRSLSFNFSGNGQMIHARLVNHGDQSRTDVYLTDADGTQEFSLDSNFIRLGEDAAVMVSNGDADESLTLVNWNIAISNV